MQIRKKLPFQESAIQVSIVWARIALTATVFKNVDFPEALEPVSRTPRSAVMEFFTGSGISG